MSKGARLADLWRTDLFAAFGLTLAEGNAMLKTILTKLDEVSDKLKTLDEHSVALAKLTERVSNIEKSIDGQRAMRRWVGLGPKRRTSQTNAPAPVVASQHP